MMDFGQPIMGEMADDELVGVAEALMEQLRVLTELQQQQIQMLGYVAQQLATMNGPKRVVRDQGGRVVGVEPAQ